MTGESRTDEAERIRLGGADYQWRGGQLHDARGRPVALRAKSLRMFSALLAARGTVVSKDRLSDLVWPDVVATDESIARCIADIRKVLDDGAHRIVETLPRQGYRLNAAAAPVVAGRDLVRPAVLAAVLGCAVAVAGAAWWLRDDAVAFGEAGSPVVATADLGDGVAILPFTAFAEDDGFLAAALSDDVEIHLAEVSGLKTVSQAQSQAQWQAIADDSASPVDVARALGVRYLVRGSVRQNGAEIGVSVQLIDGSDGTTVWADRYEGERNGLLGFRHGLPEALTGAMSVALEARDRRRLALRDTDDPEAFEEVMRARRALSTFTYEDSLTAERHLRRALERDPGYARAYAELAAAFAIRLENHWIVLSSADAEKAFYFAGRALELDPDLWLAHYAMGRLHSVIPTGDTERALEHLRRAMSIQPANDDARIYYAVVTSMSGDPAASLPIFESVMSSHPQPSFWYHLGYGHALFQMRRYEEAETSLSACLQQMPNSPYCLRSLIATYARLGRMDDAEWTIEEYRINGHDTSIAALMDQAIERDPAMRAHLRESYRLAGLE